MDEIIKEEVMVDLEEKPEEKPEVKPTLPKDKPTKKKQKKAEDFVSRKLKVINTMTDPAKAKRLAERVLANKRKAVK